MTDSAKARQWVRQAADVVRRIMGVPDYERYLTHVRECHPGTVPMSKEEFARERLASRYERPGSRCC